MKTILALLLFAATASAQSISGEIRLEPADDGRLAVLISTEPGSVAPQSFAFKLILSRDGATSIEQSGDVAGCKPVFSWSNDLSAVVVLDRNSCPLVGGRTYEVARLSGNHDHARGHAAALSRPLARRARGAAAPPSPSTTACASAH